MGKKRRGGKKVPVHRRHVTIVTRKVIGRRIVSIDKSY